jgi:dihydrofolate reductase
MRKLVLFMHVSLDGFIADQKGAIDWIKVDDNMFGYAKQRIDNSDTALYGRKTFEMMENYWPTAADKPNATKHDKDHSAWYNKVEKFVVSVSMKGQHPLNTSVISENILERIDDLKRRPGRDILIFGSPSLAHTLMHHDLIDDYWLFVNPLLMGNGIPLFDSIAEKRKMNLLWCQAFDSGVVCLHYERNKNQ